MRWRPPILRRGRRPATTRSAPASPASTGVRVGGRGGGRGRPSSVRRWWWKGTPALRTSPVFSRSERVHCWRRRFGGCRSFRMYCSSMPPVATTPGEQVSPCISARSSTFPPWGSPSGLSRLWVPCRTPAAGAALRFISRRSWSGSGFGRVMEFGRSWRTPLGARPLRSRQRWSSPRRRRLAPRRCCEGRGELRGQRVGTLVVE
jgi:hypothetical protein